ncbi:MAG: hypothetical protein Kow0098_08790 [Ignavibacteriaceae bacterium]
MFNLENFDIKLDTNFIGRHFIYADELTSTNALLIDGSNNFNMNGSVALAEKQTEGRGRRNRIWYSSKDLNLTFSVLLLKKKLFKTRYPLINLSASLAVAFALENLYQLKPEMKWPNDILLNGKKAAGILLEAKSKGNKIVRAVVGIGLNVNQVQFEGDYLLPPTSVKLETGQTIERETLLAEILNQFEKLLIKLTFYPEWILKEWKNRCKMIGEKITIKEGEEIKTGIFEDIDKDGYLLLKNGSKIEKIHYGDAGFA